MVALKIENFGGMIPAVSDYYLPDNQAALSENTWVYTGAVDGLPVLTEVYTCSSNSVRKVFRIPLGFYDKARISNSYWMEFNDPDTDVIRSPIANDTFERFYWASPSHEPRYNTKARITNGDPYFKLGIPAPGSAPGVSVTGGSSPAETRAYVYTWVSAYGEESPPSPPSSVLSGHASGTWTITLTSPSGGVTSGRNIQFVRIYRAVTSASGVATYFRVVELPIATTTYDDTTVNVSGNNQLESLYWDPPPSDLRGLVSLPNGIVAGFRSNEVYFSEPYRPHAWPVAYSLSVDYPIIGLGSIGQTLIVCTAVSPYAISGVNPATMSMSRISEVEPCMSRGSIVSTAAAVIYAGPSGLVAVTPGGAQNVTRNMITKDKWDDFLPITNLRAVEVNDSYYCWGSLQGVTFQSDAFQADGFQGPDFTGGYTGAYIDFINGRVAYNKLTTVDPTLNVFSDVWTGEAFIMKTGHVYWLDLSEGRERGTYKWRSKIFSMPNRRNIEAMRVWFEDAGMSNTPPTSCILRVYADHRLILTRSLVTDGEFVRLPSGFKAATYQFEIEANVRVTSMEISTTAKGLINV